MWLLPVSGNLGDIGSRETRPSYSCHVKTEVFTCSYPLYWVGQTFPTSLILPLPFLPLLLLQRKRSLPPSCPVRRGGDRRIFPHKKKDSEKLVSENVIEAEIEKPAVKPAENSADESVPQFKCNQCLYTNITEKGLAQHIRMKHNI